jgi:AcrR family transcriptional regulator
MPCMSEKPHTYQIIDFTEEPCSKNPQVLADDVSLLLPATRNTRADAVKNRILLLETARKLFTEHGIANVTMTDVQEAAGVGKGTLYRHFKNKAELCEALLDIDQRALQERTLHRFRQGGDPAVDLKWFVGQVVAYTYQHRDLLFHGVGPGDSLKHPAHWWIMQTLRGLVLRVTGIAKTVNAEVFGDMLYAFLDVHSLLFMMNTRGYSPERIEACMIALLDGVITDTKP